MPDSQTKLVKIPDFGVAQFPSSMPDDKILAVIRRHTGKEHNRPRAGAGVSTEGSEHARQLKSAQPLSSAIPSIPQWAETPLYDVVAKPAVKAFNKMDDFLSGRTEAQGNAYRASGERAKEEAEKKYPIVAGINTGIENFVKSMTSPVNLGLAIVAPESKLLSALFTVQALNGTYKSAEEARKAFKEGRNKDAAQYTTEAILGGATAGAAGLHVYSGLPESVRIKLASEEGYLKFWGSDNDEPFFLKSEKLITEKMHGPMVADDIHKMLLSNGVKPEELKWNGLEEFLTSKGKQKVTPEEMQRHIAENGIEIKEVTKRHDIELQKLKDQYASLENQFNSEMKVAESTKKPEDWKRATETGEKLQQLRNQIHEKKTTGSAKFGSYVLPGGKNYRELLVTMHPRASDSIEFTESGEIYGHPRYKAETAKGLAFVYFDSLSQSWSYISDLGMTLKHGFKSADEAKQELASSQQRPKSTGTFKSGHWDEPNILGHVRFNDRIGPNGENILHIEELQSDWHQTGRSKGYKDDQVAKKASLKKAYHQASAAYKEYSNQKLALRYKLEEHDRAGTLNSPEANEIFRQIQKTNKQIDEALRAEQDTYNAYSDFLRKKDYSVPNAPFKKDWHELLMKRMMRYAATNGYDGVSWTPGEAQAERYDLSKQVDHIDYRQLPNGNYSLAPVDIHGEGINLPKEEFTAQELPDVIGKEVAQKIVNGEGKPGGGRMTLRNIDLKVGGEGMKGFYDKIIPDTVNKLGKPWGVKVGTTIIGGTGSSSFTVKPVGPESTLWEVVSPTGEVVHTGLSKKDAYDKMQEENMKGEIRQFPYLPITPEMRNGITGSVQSLFGSGTASAQTPQQLLEEAKRRNPNTGGKNSKYAQTATGPNGHRIGSNDGNVWYDIATGKRVE